MGTYTSLAPVYAYSPRGKHVYLEVPCNGGRNSTLIASMSVRGMGKYLTVEGSTNKVLFEVYEWPLQRPESDNNGGFMQQGELLLETV